MLSNVSYPVDDDDVVKDEHLLRKGIPLYAEKKRQRKGRREQAENFNLMSEDKSLSIIISKSENNELITEEVDESPNVSQ